MDPAGRRALSGSVAYFRSVFLLPRDEWTLKEFRQIDINFIGFSEILITFYKMHEVFCNRCSKTHLRLFIFNMCSYSTG